MQKILIPVDDIPAIWSLIEPNFERFCVSHENRISLESLKDRAFSGDWRVWVIWIPQDNHVEAVVCAKINETASDKIASITMIEGVNRKKWLDVLSEIEFWAIEMGCQVIQMTAKKVWLKDLSDYKTKRYLLEKSLLTEVKADGILQRPIRRRDSTEHNDEQQHQRV